MGGGSASFLRASMVGGDHRFIRGNHDNPEVCRAKASGLRTVPSKTTSCSSVAHCRSTGDGARRVSSGEPTRRCRSLSLTASLTSTPARSSGSRSPMIGRSSWRPPCSRPWGHAFRSPTWTRQAFDAMFDLHRPQYWVFGHWDVTLRMERDGCTFICLGELDGFEVPRISLLLMSSKRILNREKRL
jgi:hypothetical protein